MQLEQLEEQLNRSHGQEMNELKDKVRMSVFPSKKSHVYVITCELLGYETFLQQHLYKVAKIKPSIILMLEERTLRNKSLLKGLT